MLLIPITGWSKTNKKYLEAGLVLKKIMIFIKRNVKKITNLTLSFRTSTISSTYLLIPLSYPRNWWMRKCEGIKIWIYSDYQRREALSQFSHSRDAIEKEKNKNKLIKDENYLLVLFDLRKLDNFAEIPS